MRVATTLTSTVIAATCLFGLTGLSAVANAAETTTGNVTTSGAVGADTNIQASRHFTVTTLTVDAFSLAYTVIDTTEHGDPAIIPKMIADMAKGNSDLVAKAMLGE